MAIHDDNWTKEFAKRDDMKMGIGDRAMHLGLGLVFLIILCFNCHKFFTAKWIPVNIMQIVEGAIIGGSVLIAVRFTVYFFYKAFTGRW